VALLFLLSSARVPAAADTDPRVVLVTIDGFPAAMLADEKTPIPRLRKLATAGVMAEGMRVCNPTMTWPNHTTLVTGLRADRHSVLFNGILTRGEADAPVSVDPRRDKSELVAAPTLYDLLHDAGMRTAGINWPCTRNSKSLDDDFPDSPEPLLHSTPRLRQELRASDARMNAAFIVAGRGIKSGAKIGLVDNIDVAPTIARLLGKALPNAQGRILNEILVSE
ncbi:MAG: alkaline phosphatase family protein, partial [Verrucomicrobia bacterium]|nr:alkaline phosphatase family protein [Verrucomicrobiota bacterium]